MTRRQPSVRSEREGFNAANSEAAGIILASEAEYGGEGAGLVVWAQLVQAKAQPTVRGPLFSERREA